MKVSILHYSNSIINLNKLFGMQIMELGELRELKANKIDATLYTKDLIGSHPQIKKLSYKEYDSNLFDIPFYEKFYEQCQDSDILQGNATPLLAAFSPEKTIIRLDGPVEFPLLKEPKIINSYKKANYIFVSEYLKNYYLKKYPFIPAGKCHVLYNAVDKVKYPPKKKNKKFIMMFCSRWISDKGIFVLLEALKSLQHLNDKFEVWIAGGIHNTKVKNDAQEKYELKIKNFLNEIKSIKILGYVPHEKLSELFNEIDLLLFPSLWDEPFGLVPAEAAMAKVPSIAFKVGALPEVVENNKTGILISKNRFQYINGKRLAKGIKRFIENRELAQKMGIEAEKRVSSLFNWKIYSENLLKIYSSILNK